MGINLLHTALIAALQASGPLPAVDDPYNRWELGAGFVGGRCVYSFKHYDLIIDSPNLRGDLREFFTDKSVPVVVVTNSHSRTACTSRPWRALHRAGFAHISVLRLAGQ